MPVNCILFCPFIRLRLYQNEADFSTLFPGYSFFRDTPFLGILPKKGVSLLKKRLELNMSQADLAKKTGTKQSAISRLESGTYNPSVAFLRQIASALKSKLKIQI
jgi:DNA-binding XRE family transcriptional regulator